MIPSKIVRLSEISALPDTPVMARDEGQEWVMDNHVLPYLADPDPKRILLLAPSPAFGKTHMMVKVSKHLAEQGARVFWAMPRHDMFAAMLDEARKIKADLHHWMSWQPRTSGTCLYGYESNEWLNRGNSLFDFCKGMCGIAYMQNECIYHGQAQTASNVICGHHNHIFLGHPLMRQHSFNLVIGDEAPYESAVHLFSIPKWQLCRPDTPRDNPLYDILQRLSEAVDEELEIRGKRFFDMAGGIDAIEQACASYDKWKPPRIVFYRKDIAESFAYNFHDDFVAMIRNDIRAYREYGDSGAFRVGLLRESLVLSKRRFLHSDLPKHIVWLDATPNKLLYEQVFQRPVEVVAIDTPRIGKVFQIASRRNSITKAVKWNADKTERLPMPLMTEAVLQVDQIVRERGYEQYAVATYKAVRLRFYKEPELFIHFGGNRGLNSLRAGSGAPQALFVIGTPQPPAEAIRTMAESLWHTRRKGFNTEYTGRLTGYQGTDYATQKWEYRREPALNAILWAKRDAELIQTAHRAGINSREVDVWLLTSLPIDGLPPDEILEIRDLFDPPAGFSWKRWTQLVLAAEELSETKGIVTSADIVRKVGTTSKMARKYLDVLCDKYGWQRVNYALEGKRVGIAPAWEIPPVMDSQTYYKLRAVGGDVITPREIAKALRVTVREARQIELELRSEGYEQVKVAGAPARRTNRQVLHEAD